MTDKNFKKLASFLSQRFSDAPHSTADMPIPESLAQMAGRGACRKFQTKPVPATWVELLAAVALSSPTKSDLQQRDIIHVRSPAAKAEIARISGQQNWVAQAPEIIVFCGNNHRQRLLHEWHEVTFSNDHFDALFNATGDAAIALGAFVTAAEAIGLGCCPISAVRNDPDALSELLGLPDHVFPFAGLALGFPDAAPKVSMRLPLQATYHIDRYNEDNLKPLVAQYDEERNRQQPYQEQRFTELFSESETYGWSEDKVRQYSQAERAEFGTFLRKKGFNFD